MIESKLQELQAVRDQISQIDPNSSQYQTLKEQEAAILASMEIPEITMPDEKLDDREKFLKGKINDTSVPLEERFIHLGEFNSRLAAKQEQEQIGQQQEGYATGLKETMYQILDIIMTDDMEKILGINELAALKQEGRKLMEAAVNEQSRQLYDIIGAQFEAKDKRINDLTMKNIELSTQVTDLQRKEQEHAKVAAEAAEKDAKISEITQHLQAKDEQIEKLTAEINKPKEPTIYIPNTRTNPSQSLQSLMDESKSRVRSQMDIVLSGSTYRGKVQIETPSGGSESADSFRDTTNQPDTTAEDAPITPPPLQFQEDGTADRLAETNTGTQMAGETPISRAEFEALRADVEALKAKYNGEAA